MPWYVLDDVTVAGTGNPVLTIAPACSLYFADSARLRVGLGLPGTLVADGAGGTIVFTGAVGEEFDRQVEIFSAHPDRFQLWCSLLAEDIDAPDYPDRAAAELLDDGRQHAAVDVVQPQRIHLQKGQCVLGHCPGDDTIGPDLGIVTDALQQTVSDSRCSPRPPRNLGYPAIFNLNV